MSFLSHAFKMVTPSFGGKDANGQPKGYLFATTACVVAGALALTFATAASGGGAAAGWAAVKTTGANWLGFVGDGFSGLWEGAKAAMPG